MNDNNVKIEVALPKPIVSELSYLTRLINEYDNIAGYLGLQDTITLSDLIEYVMVHIADGSRRPGAWERQLLEMLGIVPDCDELSVYRQNYGDPHSTPELEDESSQCGVLDCVECQKATPLNPETVEQIKQAYGDDAPATKVMGFLPRRFGVKGIQAIQEEMMLFQSSPELLAHLKELREQSLIKPGEPTYGQFFEGDCIEDLSKMPVPSPNVGLVPVTGEPGHYFAFSKPRNGKSIFPEALGHTLIIGQTGAGKTGPIKPGDISPQGRFVFDGANLLDADDVADDLIDLIENFRANGKTPELVKVARYLESLCAEAPKDEDDNV
ncbi:hypothetical protein AB7B51_17510 [Acinetobacter baumannii]|uniref:hypothetical protein n=1 Tax=Acinetobacter baumannii TaxID=470 RepID=UPI0034E2E9E0